METSLRVLGQEHPSTLTSMANLASAYRDQGRWKEAEELEVTKIRKRVLGQKHPDTLTSMADLAAVRPAYIKPYSQGSRSPRISRRIGVSNNAKTTYLTSDHTVITRMVGENGIA
jgi:hypothetical protein